MSHKKSKNKRNLNKGYNQNQQANNSNEVMSEKYKENSNAQE